MKDKTKRILAAGIDFFIAVLSSTTFIGIITSAKFSITPHTITIYLVILFSLILTKDCVFKNASIGKRIFKIKVAKTDGTRLMVVDIIKRNVSIIILLPLEIFFTIINDTRIGDIWSNTCVICDNRNNDK